MYLPKTHFFERQGPDYWGAGYTEPTLPTYPMHLNNVEVYPLTVSYITHTSLAWQQQLVSVRRVSTFNFWLKP